MTSGPRIVTRETFARAESDRMFRDIAHLAGGVNKFYHIRKPTPLDKQTVIRMNRDTIYSGVVIDTRKGATLVIPPLPEGRYASVLIIDNDHYLPAVFYTAGRHAVPQDTGHVFAAVRIQVFDPTDPDEIALINALQDQFRVEAGSAEPLADYAWDDASMTSLRAELEEASRRYPDLEGAFGRRGQVDAEKHLCFSAAAWGGFMAEDATYLAKTGMAGSAHGWRATYVPPRNRAFWSITVYGATGFIESEASIVNSSNVVLNADGTFTVHYGSIAQCGDVPNRLDTPQGWNVYMRIYRPDPSVLGGGYVLPEFEPMD